MARLYIVVVNRTASPARATLAELNAARSLPRASITVDFDLTTALQVGRWGLAYSRDGYNGRGQGGDKLHVSAVTTITAIHPDYDWRPYCASSAYVGYGTPAQQQQRREKQVAGHGTYNHHCNQPKVGDVVRVEPLCRFENVRGTAAFTADQADTNLVTCANCAAAVFGEDKATIAAEQREAAKAAVAARKAAKPLPARCFHCGDIRPQTKATKAGEQLPCSNCKDNLETIWWVETTGYSNSYFAEFPAPHLLDLALRDETEAYNRLERVEGKYRRS